MSHDPIDYANISYRYENDPVDYSGIQTNREIDPVYLGSDKQYAPEDDYQAKVLALIEARQAKRHARLDPSLGPTPGQTFNSPFGLGPMSDQAKLAAFDDSMQTARMKQGRPRYEVKQGGGGPMWAPELLDAPYEFQEYDYPRGPKYPY